MSVTSSQNALDRFPDIEQTSRRDISISDSWSISSLETGVAGSTPLVGVGFLFGLTVRSLAPVKSLNFYHFKVILFSVCDETVKSL